MTLSSSVLAFSWGKLSGDFLNVKHRQCGVPLRLLLACPSALTWSPQKIPRGRPFPFLRWPGLAPVYRCVERICNVVSRGCLCIKWRKVGRMVSSFEKFVRYLGCSSLGYLVPRQHLELFDKRRSLPWRDSGLMVITRDFLL